MPIIGGLAGAAKAAISFESTFAGVRKTVDGVVDSSGKITAFGVQLQTDFRNMAKSMPESVEGINKVGEAAGQLGIKKEFLVDFTRTAVMMGETTDLSSDQAATGLAQLTNILGTSQAKVGNLASSIVALGNDGASTESQILAMSLRIAGAGKATGMTEGDVLGLANAMSSLGIDAEMGGTAMQKSIIAIASAVSKGGPEVGNFAKVARMTNDEFVKLFKLDPGQAFARFLQGLSDIKSSGGDLIGVLGKMGVEEARLLNTMLRVGNSGTLVADSMKLGNKAFSEASALQKEYEQRMQTTSAQLRIVWNNVKDLGIELGFQLLPILKDAAALARTTLLPAVEGLVKWFGALPGPVKAAALGFALVVAAVGPLLVIAGAVAGGISSLLGLLGAFAPAAAVVAEGATGISVAWAGVTAIGSTLLATVGSIGAGLLAFVTSPITLTVAAVAGLAYGLRLLTGSWEFILTPAREVWGVMKDLWSIITSVTTLLAGGFMSTARSIGSTLKDLGVGLKDWLVSGVKSAFEWFKILHPELVWVADKIAWLLGLGKKAVVETAKTARDGLHNVAEGLSETARSTASKVDAPGIFQGQKLSAEFLPSEMLERDFVKTTPLAKPGAIAVPDVDDLTGKSKKGRKTKTPSDEIPDAKRKIAELDFALKHALENRMPLDQMLSEYGSALTDVTNKHATFAKELGKLPPSIAAVKSMQFAEEMRKWREGAGHVDDGINELLGSIPEIKETWVDAFLELAAVNTEFAESNARTTRTALGNQLADIEKGRREAVAKLGSIPTDPLLRAQWLAGRKNVDEYFNHQRDLATGTASTIVERMRAAGVQTKADLALTAAAATRDYNEMKDSGEFSADAIQAAFERMTAAQVAAGQLVARTWSSTFSGIAQAAGALGHLLTTIGGHDGAAAVVNAGAGITDMFAGSLKDYKSGNRLGAASPLFNSKASTSAKIGAGAEVAMSVIGGISDWKQATEAKTAGARLGGGAMAGAKAGAAFGPYGIAIGAAAGFVAALIKGKPEWVKAADEIGRNMGVKISDTLAQQIAGDAKKLFHGDARTAETFNLGKIIAEDGGVTDKTLTKWTRNLRDVFSAVQTGAMTTQQAGTVIEEVWPQLAATATKHGGIISRQMIELMKLNQDYGTSSASMSQFVQTSLGNGLGKLATFLKLSSDAAGKNLDDIKARMAEIDAERTSKRGNGDAADQAKVAALDLEYASLDKKKHSGGGLAITNTTSANAMASAIAASVAQLGKEGVPLADAIAQAEPAVASLQAQLTALGIDGGAAFASLSAKIAIAKDDITGPMVEGIQSLSGAMVDFYNGGVLTTDMFVGMADQIGQTRQAMLDTGASADAVNGLMQPQLQSLWEMQQRFHGELDDTTQAMLDEAEASGVVGEQHKSDSKQMIDGLKEVNANLAALISGLGIALPAAVGTGAAAIARKMKDAKGAIDGVLDGIPTDINVRVNFKAGDVPTLPPGDRERRDGYNDDGSGGFSGDGLGGGLYDDNGLPRMAEGGVTSGPTLAGEGGQPEIVGPVGFIAHALRLAILGSELARAPQPLAVPPPSRLDERNAAADARLEALHNGTADDTTGPNTASGRLFQDLDRSLTRSNRELISGTLAAQQPMLLALLARRDAAADARLAALRSGAADDTASADAPSGRLFVELDGALTQASAALRVFTTQQQTAPDAAAFAQAGSPGHGSSAGDFVQIAGGGWVPRDHPLAQALPSYDVGGLVPKDQIAKVHGGELVGPVHFMSDALGGALRAVGLVDSIGTIVTNSLRQLRADAPAGGSSSVGKSILNGTWRTFVDDRRRERDRAKAETSNGGIVGGNDGAGSFTLELPGDVAVDAFSERTGRADRSTIDLDSARFAKQTDERFRTLASSIDGLRDRMGSLDVTVSGQIGVDDDGLLRTLYNRADVVVKGIGDNVGGSKTRARRVLGVN